MLSAFDLFDGHNTPLHLTLKNIFFSAILIINIGLHIHAQVSDFRTSNYKLGGDVNAFYKFSKVIIIAIPILMCMLYK